MKIKHFIPFVLLLLGMLSCEGEVIDPEKGRKAELFAEIEGVKTRVCNTTWESGDAIGVLMKSADEPLATGILKENARYVTDGTSSFESASEADKIFFPLDGSAVDFISYYPYREDILDFKYLIDLTDQSVQASIDLMYSDNAKNFDAENPRVEMLFSHQLSKIMLDITLPESVEPDELTVVVSGAARKATFDIESGTISEPAEYGDISFKVDSDNAGAEGILLPTDDLSEMEFWFFISSNSHAYKYPLKESSIITRFEKSTRYTYNVTLLDDETVVVTEGNITGWVEGPSEDAKARPGDKEPPAPVFGDGTKEHPYSVAEAQKEENLGKTEVWIEGYIVGAVKDTMIKFQSGDTCTVSSNIVLANNKNETDADKMVPVNLSEASTSIRNALNLPENRENFNKKVKITGNIETYFSVPGLRKPKGYEFIDL